MRSISPFLAISLGLAGSSAGALVVRDSTTAQVNFGNNTGTPEHLASGILYGVPDTPNQIPDHFYTDMGFNYLRAGGAQLPAPARGWIWGLEEYKNRFASALSNYRTARQHGAKFVFLIHDLWGADGSQNSTAPYPGDNGNFTYWDEYFTQLTADMRSNNMIEDVIIDIWNEPDGGIFWKRDESQFLQYWGRAYYQFRDAFGTELLTSGPSTAGEPGLGNGWWTDWASFVQSNASIPDQWTWHMESGGGNMLEATAGLDAIRARYNLPSRVININEYAVFNEQVPAGSAWWISQLERVGAIGLRGNWLSVFELHDFLASLLGKPNAQDQALYNPQGTGYWPNGDYQVYEYYNLNMTGHRVGTLPSDDMKFDCYATVGSDKARVLVGVRQSTGTWTLQLNDLDKLGLPSSGTLNVRTYGFPVSLDIHFGEIDGPVDLGVYGHSISGGSTSFPIFQTDTNTAYVFEFDIPNSGSTTTTTRTATTTSVKTTTSSSATITTGVRTSKTTTKTTLTTASTTTAAPRSSSTTTTSGSSSTSSSTTTHSGASSTTAHLGSSSTASSSSTVSSTLSGTTTTGLPGRSTSSSASTTGGITGSSTRVGSTSSSSLSSSTSSTMWHGIATSTSASRLSSLTNIRTTSSSGTSSSSKTTSIVSSGTTGGVWGQWSVAVGTRSTQPASASWTTSSTLAQYQSWNTTASKQSQSWNTITSIVLTETYVVPCSTGLTTLTTYVTTTHCGCTEKPIPTVTMTVTTITPSAGWSISTPYVATVPAQGSTATVNTPAASTGTPQSWSTVAQPEASSVGASPLRPQSWSGVQPQASSVGASALTAQSWSALQPQATSVGTSASGSSTSGVWQPVNSALATYTGSATSHDQNFMLMIFPVIAAAIFL